MRTVGLAYMAIFVVALTAFLEAGAARQPSEASAQAPEPAAPPVSIARAAPASPMPDAARLSPEGPPQPTRVSGAPRAPERPRIRPDAPRSVPDAPRMIQDAPRVAQEAPRIEQEAPVDRRRRYRRSRNRYPGPIPTPADWEPPEGPVRIALQAGHWRADEAPRELSGLKGNGTSWRGTQEWQANLAIAERAGELLEDLGYEVDILPAVVPPSYRAHLFISIHADGSNDPNASGYRVAAPSRDATGRADRIADLLLDSYGKETGIRRLPDVTRRMRNYYAFNFRRYEHALHPMTIAVILETGFLTSPRDREVIVDDPDRAARGIVEAVRAFDITPPPAVAAGSRATARPRARRP